MQKIVSVGLLILVCAVVVFTLFFVAGHVVQWMGCDNMPLCSGLAGVIVFLFAVIIYGTVINGGGIK